MDIKTMVEAVTSVNNPTERSRWILADTLLEMITNRFPDTQMKLDEMIRKINGYPGWRDGIERAENCFGVHIHRAHHKTYYCITDAEVRAPTFDSKKCYDGKAIEWTPDELGAGRAGQVSFEGNEKWKPLSTRALRSRSRNRKREAVRPLETTSRAKKTKKSAVGCDTTPAPVVDTTPATVVAMTTNGGLQTAQRETSIVEAESIACKDASSPGSPNLPVFRLDVFTPIRRKSTQAVDEASGGRPVAQAGAASAESSAKKTSNTAVADNGFSTDQLSPVSFGIVGLAGQRKSVPTLKARSEGKTLDWKVTDSAVDAGDRKREHAKKIELFIHAISGGDATCAAGILHHVIRRKGNESLREKFESYEREDNVHVNIVENIKAWLQRHGSKGKRKKDYQNAVDAVSVACLFREWSEGAPDQARSAIANVLGINGKALQKFVDWGRELVQSGGLFEPKESKQRSDFYQYHAFRAIRAFIHSDEGTRANTDSTKVYSCADPEDDTITTKVSERIWHEISWGDKYRAFLLSLAYRNFQKKSDVRRTISLTMFKQGCCKCVKQPKHQSCVDIVDSRLHHLTAAARNVLNRPEIQQKLNQCECDWHRRFPESKDESAKILRDGEDGQKQGSEAPLRTQPRQETTTESVRRSPWYELLRQSPKGIVAATCCKAVKEPMLRARADGRIPEMIPWRCTHPEGDEECSSCGVEGKFGLFTKCPVLNSCETILKVRVWEEAERSGDQKQLELTEKMMTVCEALAQFVEKLTIARKHHQEAKWLSTVKYLDIRTLLRNQLLIFTDFSASLNLVAGETDNCSTARHGVLCIFVVLHSRRTVTVVNKSGTSVAHDVYDCDVWHFFGDDIGRGKKNDHVFHNASLDRIVEYYKGMGIDLVKLWTDNCPTQYKCRQNFLMIATFGDRHHGLDIQHRFAQKFCFKGVWDGAGKVVKDLLRDEENSQKGRFANALECFKRMVRKANAPVSKFGEASEAGGQASPIKDERPWAQWEKNKDPRILDKGVFKTTRKMYGYITEDSDEYEELKKDYEHIVFVSRDDVPDMNGVKGTQKLHSVSSSHASKVAKDEASSGPRRKGAAGDT